MASESAADTVTLTALGLRPTRRVAIFVPLGLFLFAAGANVGAGFLLVLAGALVASVPWAWVVTRRASRTVRVRREVPREVVAGQPVAVAVHVEAAATGSIVVRDELTGTVGVVEQPREGGVLEGDAVLARGVASGGVVAAEVTDPLGLFRARVAGTVPSRLEALPASRPFRPVELVRAASRRAEQRPRRVGEGAETEGTREYRRGDPARSVHWRSSARRGELVVRRLVGEASGRLRVDIATATWDRAQMDRACAIVLAVADGAEAGGVQVEVVVGTHLVDWQALTGRRLLAHLRPHLGTDGDGDGSPDPGAPGLVGAREATTAAPADVGFRVQPTGGGVEVFLELDGTRAPVGVFSSDRPVADVPDWLGEHLRGKVTT